MDRYGRGSYTWTPTVVTDGNAALLRLTSVEGPTSDVSDSAFLVANAGTAYYVNVPGDADFSDNEYTTAVGDNANSGKSPDRPMASLARLVAAYDLDPGDVIYVDAGTYNQVANVVLGAEDSGVRIVGAVNHATTLNRANTNTGNYGVELAGADDVTIDRLSATGGEYGIYASSTADSDRFTLTNSTAFANFRGGVQLAATNDFATFTGNLFYGVPGGVTTDNQTTGLGILGTDALVADNEVHDTGTGIDVSGERFTIRGNRAWNNSTTGIDATAFVGTVSDNDVYQTFVLDNTNVATGIRVSSRRSPRTSTIKSWRVATASTASSTSPNPPAWRSTRARRSCATTPSTATTPASASWPATSTTTRSTTAYSACG